MIKFEFDENKSKSNALKHNIDFIEAQMLWNDSNLLEIPAKTTDEERSVVIGLYAGKHWSAVITYRDQYVRIISVRRSRSNEVSLYEG